MLELIDVRKEYPSGVDGSAVAVLDGVSLKVKSGQSVSIVGPSGCGKSTLLNIISGLDEATSGRVIFAGDDVAQMSEKQRVRLRNEKIGFVFQLHHLLPQCTVMENVLLPTLAGHTKSNGAEQRAKELLDSVGLGELQGRLPGELSVGQRQRVALARALVNEPDLLLADEPTGSLDETTAESIADLLAELNEKRSVTLIVVTHAMSLARKMGRVMELHEGKLREADVG